MKLYFYNIQPVMANEIKNALQHYNHSLQLTIPLGIILFYAENDSMATRTMLRSVLLSNKFPVFILSATPQVAAMAWKVNAAYYVDISQREWAADLRNGFTAFLFKNTANYHKKISIPSQKKIDFIYPDQIIYLKADRNYTEIYLENDTKLVIAKNLREVEKILSDFDFIERFGKSIIINLNTIKAIQGKAIEFKNGQKLNFPKYGNSFVYLKERLMWQTPKKITEWNLLLDDRPVGQMM
ncbi:MAG: LytTR family DNA-binding domain-containing protein [Bacteroidota bacterium]